MTRIKTLRDSLIALQTQYSAFNLIMGFFALKLTSKNSCQLESVNSRQLESEKSRIYILDICVLKYYERDVAIF